MLRLVRMARQLTTRKWSAGREAGLRHEETSGLQGGTWKEFMHSSQSTGKPKFCLEHRGSRGRQRRRLEKYVGPGHSGIILSALQAKECVRVLVRNRSLWQVLSKVMKRLSFAFRKFILVGSVEDEWRGHMWKTGRPLKRWLGLPRIEIVKPEYGGKGWGDKGGSEKERLWDSRKWETLNAVKLS